MEHKQPLQLAVVWQACVELLSFFPFFLLLGVLLFEENSLFIWFISLLLLFLSSYVITVFSRSPVLTLLLNSGLVLLIAWFLADQIWKIVVLFLLLFIVAYRGIQYANSNWDQVLPGFILWVAALPGYFIIYLLFYFVESWQVYLPLISGVGLLFIVMLLLVTNQHHLQRESLSKSKQQLSKGMARLNRGYLLLTLTVVLLLTNFQLVQSSLYHMVRGIIQFFIWLGSLFQQEEAPTEEPEPVPPPPMFEDEPPPEPSPFVEWMELLMKVVAVILLIIGLAFVIALLFKKFRRLLKRIWLIIWQAVKRVLTRNQEQETITDYEDVEENLFDWQNWRKKQQQKWKKVFTSKTKRKPHSAEEQVRTLYQEVAIEIKGQEKWHHALTAHEVLELSENRMLKQQLQALYDDIRYGNKTLSEQERAQIDKLWEDWQQK